MWVQSWLLWQDCSFIVGRTLPYENVVAIAMPDRYNIVIDGRLHLLLVVSKDTNGFVPVLINIRQSWRIRMKNRREL